MLIVLVGRTMICKRKLRNLTILQVLSVTTILFSLRCSMQIKSKCRMFFIQLLTKVLAFQNVSSELYVQYVDLT